MLPDTLRGGWWIMDQVHEIHDWCKVSIEHSRYFVLYEGKVLAFYPMCDDEEVLFRMRWGQLFP